MHRTPIGQSREKFSQSRCASACALSLLLVMGQTAPLLGNPTGGAVVAGSATIGSAGATLTINQSTQNAIINWQQFSIAHGELTKFIVPNAGATLNRVTGGNPSAIYGTLQSNGTLYLVNPNGIVVGPSGRIDTGSFLASTLDVSNEQFLKGGDLSFSGSSTAAINNEGLVHASTGDVYLIANQVTNNGLLSAPQGTVGLAAGQDVLFQQAGSEHLFVQATPSGTKRALGVNNTGTIRAAAAELKAAGGNAYALAINNTGVIAATGFKKINGQVYLTSDGGSITNSGKISAKQANGNGGTIAITGTSTTSTISANTVTNSGTLDASATVAGGTGGSVSIKNMSGATVHSGAIIAKGGQGGTGGNAEVSGKTVGFTGTVDLTAPGGTTGNLLLDPATLDVIEGFGGNIVNNANDPTMSTIGASTVDDALSTANLTLNADTNITIDAAILWQNATTLTLSTNTSGSTININAAIGGTGAAGLVIDTAGASDVISCPGYVELSNFTLENGSWIQNQTVTQNSFLPIFYVSNDFQLQGGTFLRTTSGTGTSGSPYVITDVYGLEGINSPSGNLLSSSFVQSGSIDASSTPGWNGGQGFMPIGNGSTVFSGSYNGNGFAITGLTIDMPSANDVGLFGVVTAGANITNLNLVGVAITGSSNVGGVAGVNMGGMISDVNVSGTVTGDTTSNGNQDGGVVGANNSGSLSNVYNSATVVGGGNVGGVAGYNNGSITQAVNTGFVNAGQSSDGGLVGYDDTAATVTDSWNTGTVMGGMVNVGGLIGYNRGTVSMSYNSGPVTGETGAVGGLAGENDDFNSSPALIENCYSTGSVTGTNSNPVGGFVGGNFGTITDCYSSGLVSGSNGAGGFTPYNFGTITGCFWDTSTSGQSSSGGPEMGESTAALLMLSTYTAAGWDFGTGGTDLSHTWVTFDASTRPFLSMEYSTTITNGHQLQLVGLNATTLSDTYVLANDIDLTEITNASEIWGTNAANGAGFVPIGGFPTNSFTGTFNGLNNKINGLYINATQSDFVGLFGDVASGGIVENLALTNVDVTAPSTESVGAFAGAISGGTLANDYCTGTVSGFGDVGGLVGQNVGTVMESYSACTVSGSSAVGGLAGDNNGTINDSYSTGSVMGQNGTVGGLVGLNQGPITDAYTTATVTSGNGLDSGGFVGDELSGSAIINSFWDTDTAGSAVISGVGSDATPNTTAGLTAATTAQLQMQSFIEANEPAAPPWDFSNVWTTDGDSLTPQLINLPTTPLPTGGSGGSIDTLSGTAFSDNGSTPDMMGVTIDLVFGGSIMGSTTTDSSGAFTLNVNSSELTSGVLLTDATAFGGNTYYQANSPAMTITAVDIYGGTLRIMADNASNTALGIVAAGASAAAGINYSVNSAHALSSTATVDLSSASNYTLDGNITTGGSFLTSSGTGLTGSQNVTITAAAATLSGSLASMGSVTVMTTTGDIDVSGLGNSDIPATAAAITLTSAGAVSMSNSNIVLAGGDFTASGTGSSTDLNGIDITNSTIDTEGGNISLTGQASEAFIPQVGNVAGEGVFIPDSVLETTGGREGAPTTGNITIQGNGTIDPELTVTNNLIGADLNGTTATVVNGAISITGTVSSGSADVFSTAVIVQNGSSVAATGTGSITINGDAAGSTAVLYNDGVNIVDASLSVGGGASGISIMGTAGNFANTTAANAVGVSVYAGSLVTAEGAAPISITGTGGNDTLGDANGYSGGILVSSGSAGVMDAISTESGTLTLTGTGSVSTNFSFGVNVFGVDPGSAAISSTSGAITLTGSLTATDNPCFYPQAIVLQTNGSVTTQTGAIAINGTVAGIAVDDGTAVQASGVIIRTGAMVAATGNGTVSIDGVTTGALSNTVNYGVQIDDAQVTAADGALSIIGGVGDVTGTVNSEGLLIADGATVSVANAPVVLSGTVSGGTSAASAFIAGLQVNASSVTATGTGSISINGDALGSTGSANDVGVYMVGATVSAVDASGAAVSGINLTGEAGALANEASGSNAGTVGLYLYTGTTITATGTAPITMVGDGGTDTDATLAANAFSCGIFLASEASGLTSSISTTSGAISLTGVGGVSPRFSTGLNIYGPIGGEALISSTSGSITIDGSMTSLANPSLGLYGLDLQVGADVSTQGGTITIDGTVHHGAATTGTDEAAAVGVLLTGGATVEATGTGSVFITGDSTGVTGNYQLGGVLFVDGDISTVGGSITLDGVDSTSSTVSDELFGIVIRSESQLFSQDGSISLTGTVSSGTAGLRDFGVRVSEGSTVMTQGANGTVTVTGSTVGSTSDSFTTGVIVEGEGSTITSSGMAGLAVTGNAGTLAGTTGAILDPSGDGVYYNPATVGIVVSDGGALQAFGSGETSPAGPVTLTGSGGSNTSTDPTAVSRAVAIFSPVADETTSLDAGATLSISGSSLVIGGHYNVGVVSITSSGGTTLTSSGGPASTIGGEFSGPVSLNGGDFMLDLVANTNLDAVSVDNLVIQGAGFDVSLGATTSTNIAINGAGAITQTGPLNTSLLTVANAGSVTLTDAGNNISELGDISSNGAINVFTDPGLTLTGTVTSPAPITIAETAGNLTLASGAQVLETGSGDITLAAGTTLANSHYIVNDSTLGASAIDPGEGISYLYSSDPTYDNLGGVVIPADNAIYGAVYPTSSQTFDGNGSFASFYYVSMMGDVGPNPPNTTVVVPPPSTTTGGAAGGGSNIVPPVLTPQPVQVSQQSNPIVTSGGSDESGEGSQPPPFSYAGTGLSTLEGETSGDLANSDSNSGQVATGDTAQIGGGQLNNVSNPQAAGALNEALGPIVYQNLSDALKTIGDWADVPDETRSSGAAGGSDETILTGGDVAEMTGSKVTNIPLSQAPVQLRNAMNNGGALQSSGVGQ